MHKSFSTNPKISYLTYEKNKNKTWYSSRSVNLDQHISHNHNQADLHLILKKPKIEDLPGCDIAF